MLVREPGDPSVLRIEDVPDSTPSDGEVVVKLEAVGVNFIDVNERSGAYPIAMPFTPGSEGAGTVADVGPGVDGLSPGDRVAFAGVPGAYAQYIVAKAQRLVQVPQGVSTDVAAAVMLQGMTAHYLAHSVCPLEEDDWCLIHAAAGGVGLLFTQLAKERGLRVIGTTSTEAKAERARGAGADEVVDYSKGGFADAVRGVTGGAGVRAVFDSVGKSTFDESLRCLARRGYLVLFGQSSGPVDPVDPRTLQHGGSLFLTRPRLADYTATREELLYRSGDVLSKVESGRLDVHVHESFPLEDAPKAHAALKSRTTMGKLILTP